MEKICKNCTHWNGERVKCFGCGLISTHSSSGHTFGECNELQYNFEKIIITALDEILPIRTREDFGCVLFKEEGSEISGKDL